MVFVEKNTVGHKTTFSTCLTPLRSEAWYILLTIYLLCVSPWGAALSAEPRLSVPPFCVSGFLEIGQP